MNLVKDVKFKTYLPLPKAKLINANHQKRNCKITTGVYYINANLFDNHHTFKKTNSATKELKEDKKKTQGR